MDVSLDRKHEKINENHSPQNLPKAGEEYYFIQPETLISSFEQLKDPELQEKNASFLAYYFRFNPFDKAYDPNLIFSLMNFFDPNSQFGLDGVDIASKILSAFFEYESENPGHNHQIIYELMNQNFYQNLFPYIFKSAYVLSTFEFMLYVQLLEPFIARERMKAKNGIPLQKKLIDFLIESQIFEEMKKVLSPDFSYLGSTYSFFEQICHYKSYYDSFKIDIQNIINAICQLSTMDKEYNDSDCYGYKCLGTYGRMHSEIGFQIISNENIQETYSKIETLDEDTKNCILDMIDDILLNEETSDASIIPGILIRKQVQPFNLAILNGLFKLVHLPNLTNDVLLRLLSVLSHLFLTIEDINLCIKTGFGKFIFDIISGDFQFKVKREAIAALCVLVSSGNKETIGFFIDNNFVGIIGDFIDNLMNDIPHEILDAFDEIILNSEMNEEECSQWSTLVFNNENIVDALEKASNNEYLFEDDFDKYYYSLCEHADALLARIDNLE